MWEKVDVLPGSELTDLLLLGALEDALPVLVVDRLGDAHRLADDVDAAQDGAACGGGEGKDCGKGKNIG